MSTDAQQPKTPDEIYKRKIEAELERIGRRRGLASVKGYRPWGLSLSGGGIRSATFCLGVLQALSRAPLPPGAAALDFDDSPQPPRTEDKLLGQMDYLSTVSGGGYVGTFFASLFVPKRSTRGAGPGASAANAYATLREEAGRLRSATIKDKNTTSAQRAMSWLRENGRYLAPSSAGDLLYGAAIAARAWVGLQLVLGMLLLLLLAALNLAKQGLLAAAEGGKWTSFIVTLAQPGQWRHDIWLSGLWLFPALLAIVCVIPCGIAYWMTYPPAHQSLNTPARQPPLYWTVYLGCAAVLALGLAIATQDRGSPTWRWDPVQSPFAILVLEMLAGAAWYVAFRGDCTFARLRIRLTRQLTFFLKIVGVLAFLALVDTLAQGWLLHQQTVTKPLTAAAVLTWLVRRVGPQLKNLQNTKRTRIPVEALLALAAAVLAVLLVVVWDYAVLWLQWEGVTLVQRPDCANCEPLRPEWRWLALLLGSSFVLSLMMGRYPEFLNLSSLQNLYSARLTRAYQGASNAERFEGDDDKTLSSAEAMDSDHISHADYNSNPYAPLHIINICLNQNVDPAEQLVQRDRKGRPLAILPAVMPPRPGPTSPPPLPFALDGTYHECDSSGANAGYTLSIGEWIGVSGAAAATGSGRRTSAAMALLLGLANVRLGRWWRSGTTSAKSTGVEGVFRAILPMQAYLIDELSAHFYGTRRPLHYLSDGGHFENTGLYELLRPERNLRFAIVCDCGADPLYQFDDLANLIRLARIDFGIEIEVDTDVASSTSHLRSVFGTAEELAEHKPDSNKCAMLLNVYRKPQARLPRTPDMRIVLIKPVLIAGAPLDVHNYGRANPDFPQQTTGDQFFDEAQWESYRKLGFEIGRRIFDSTDPAYQARLWTDLL